MSRAVLPRSFLLLALAIAPVAFAQDEEVAGDPVTSPAKLTETDAAPEGGTPAVPPKKKAARQGEAAEAGTTSANGSGQEATTGTPRTATPQSAAAGTSPPPNTEATRPPNATPSADGTVPPSRTEPARTAPTANPAGGTTPPTRTEPSRTAPTANTAGGTTPPTRTEPSGTIPTANTAGGTTPSSRTEPARAPPVPDITAAGGTAPPSRTEPARATPTADVPAPSSHGHGSAAAKDMERTLEQRAHDEARRFFGGILAGDARLITGRAGYPFVLESRRFDTPDALLPEWIRHLRALRSDLLTLYGIEILTPDQMEAKYGKPPARLAQLPLKYPRVYVAVANISGRAAIAILRDTPSGMLVIGFTD